MPHSIAKTTVNMLQFFLFHFFFVYMYYFAEFTAKSGNLTAQDTAGNYATNI